MKNFAYVCSTHTIDDSLSGFDTKGSLDYMPTSLWSGFWFDRELRYTRYYEYYSWDVILL